MRLLKLAFLLLIVTLFSFSCTDENSVTSSADTNGVEYLSANFPENSISGPNRLDAGETGTWTINVPQGISPNSYTWYQKPSDGTWSKVGTGSSYSQGTGNGETDYQLKVEVAGNDSRQTFATHPVIIGSGVDRPE